MMTGTFDKDTQEFLDFARCQRPDGSYYGTAGTCRKGKPVSDADVNKLKKAAKKGNKKAKLAVAVVEGKKTKSQALKELKGEKVLTEKTQKKKVEPKPKEKTNPAKEGGYSPKDAKSETGVKAEKLKDAFGNDNFKFSPEESKNRIDRLAERKMPAKDKKKLTKTFELEEKQSKNNEKFVKDLEKNLPKGTKLEVGQEGIVISSKTASGDTVSSTYNLTTGYGFKVNDSFNAGSVTDRVGQVRVASAVRGHYDALIKSLPTGHVMKTSAWTQDGKGAMRQRAYEKMGFSKDTPGNSITAVKQADGSMAPGKPGNKGLKQHMDQQGKADAIWFSESERDSVKNWMQIIFGIKG